MAVVRQRAAGAIAGAAVDADNESKEFTDEDTESAALAEGRVDPPLPSRGESA